MTAFDVWPFTDVRTVERRGELQILAGMSPDGLPVTITRLAPETARDASLRRRFKDAIEAATRQAGADDPPILWADPSTLVPWAATYDDPDHLGADLIEGVFAARGPAASGVTSHQTMVQESDGEKSVPALDPNSFPDYDTPPPQYQTPHPLYDTTRPVEYATPPPGVSDPVVPATPATPAAPASGGSGGRGSRTPLYVGLGVGGLVVALLLGSVIALSATRERDTSSDPGQVPTAGTTGSSSPANQITTAPARTKSASPKSSAGDGKPKLKKRKPVSVYGPTWKKHDKTFLMAFKQLGWAFRAPGDFDCFVREHTDRKTKVLCFKVDAPKKKTRRVIIVDRYCTGKSCSKKERKKLERDPWNRKVHHYKRADKRTKYVTGTFKNTKNHRKYFGFELSHYYKDDKGHLRRHVQVWADAPYKSRYAKQIEKTVNSIRTQTG